MEMIMKNVLNRKGIFIVLLLFVSLTVYSQNTEGNRGAFKDRLFTGGGLGLQFGTWSTLVDVTPVIGYYLTDNVVFGLGGTYKYYRYKNAYYVVFNNGESKYYDLIANMLGGSIFARYYFKSDLINIFNNLFAHVEYEYLNYKYNDYRLNESGSDINTYKMTTDIHSFFVGGGLRQMVGGRSFLYLMILWNLNDSFYSPYSNPVIRIGFNVGI